MYTVYTTIVLAKSILFIIHLLDTKNVSLLKLLVVKPTNGEWKFIFLKKSEFYDTYVNITEYKL